MLLFVPVIIAFIFGIFRGGSIRYLASAPFHGLPLLLGATAIKAIIGLPSVAATPFVESWGSILQVGAIVVALLGLFLNWRLGPGARLIIIGFMLNAVVVALNHGAMPVSVAASYQAYGPAAAQSLLASHSYANVQPMSSNTQLSLLGDILTLGMRGIYVNVFSIGDLLIAVGTSLLAYRLIRRPNIPNFLLSWHPA